MDFSEMKFASNNYQEHFACTVCHISFPAVDGDGNRSACPKCGEGYGHFFTKLIRCSSFAFAYWMNDNPDVVIKPYVDTENK